MDAARAQQYLTLSWRSASEALGAMQSIRERRVEEGIDPRGRPRDQDQDLLRAMLVFACAGVDAAMKALIEDALPTLAGAGEVVQETLDRFAQRYMAPGGVLNPGALATVLAHAESPRVAIIQEFIDDLTGGSLQSSEQLKSVCAALGIRDDELYRDIADLGPVFRARNEIVHELDLSPEGRFNRRQRPIGEMVGMANQAFDVAQRVINEVVEALEEEGQPPAE